MFCGVDGPLTYGFLGLMLMLSRSAPPKPKPGLRGWKSLRPPNDAEP